MRQFLVATLLAIAIPVFASDDVRSVPDTDVLDAYQPEEPEFDAEAVNVWMRQYVLEHPREPKATRENCPPGFDCSELESEVKPSDIRQSIDRVIGDGTTPGVIPGTAEAGLVYGDCPAGFDGQCHERKKPGFFGRTNVAFMTVQFAGAFLDMKTTMNAFALEGSYDGFVDGRPAVLVVTAWEISGPEEKYIRDGWGSFALYKLAINVPVALGAHYFSRSDNTFLKGVGWLLRSVQAILGGVQWRAGYDNWQFNRDMRSQIYDFQHP